MHSISIDLLQRQKKTIPCKSRSPRNHLVQSKRVYRLEMHNCELTSQLATAAQALRVCWVPLPRSVQSHKTRSQSSIVSGRLVSSFYTRCRSATHVEGLRSSGEVAGGISKRGITPQPASSIDSSADYANSIFCMPTLCLEHVHGLARRPRFRFIIYAVKSEV